MDQVAQVREKVDIVSFLSEFLTLKKTGHNFKAVCPFHNEKTPSFVVSPERQIWHCFGCQKGGDVFTFLMEYEHLDFGEALRFLAKRTGVELESGRYETHLTSQKDKIYAMNNQAVEFYHYVLLKHPAGKQALAYLEEKRLLSKALIETFMIGFSPTSGNALTNYLAVKKKYAWEDIMDAGLGTERRGRIADFFMNRIMFPLYDHRDNIIGFSARTLSDSKDIPKYINTRETLVYHKGQVFYGLNSAKDDIKKTGRAIVVEGEFDVISCFHNGIPNTIAVKGTAFTEDQAHLLSRFATKVTLCFDEDNAGQMAIKRSIPALEKKGFTITVAVIPGGKDPDESFKSDPYAFKKSLKEDVNVYDYVLSKLLEKSSNSSAEGKKKITDELLPLYSAIENEIVKEHYLKKLSAALDTTYESILRQIEKRRDTTSKPQKVITPVRRAREEMLEEYLVSVILQSMTPKLVLEKVITILEESMSKERAYQKILYHLISYFQKSELFNSSQFAQVLPAELLNAFNKCFLIPIRTLPEGKNYINEAEKAARDLKAMYLRSQIKQLGQKIKEKEQQQGLNEELIRLQEKFSSLVSRLHEV